MELFNILESSLIRMLSLILRFKAQSRVPGPSSDPQNAENGKKLKTNMPVS